MADEQDKINEISNKITSIIKDINISLSNNQPKIIICYTPTCEFCDEYCESIDKEYKDKEGNMEVWYFNVDELNFKMWAKYYEVKNLPCTLFMNKDNVIKGKIDGRIEVDKINEIARQIFEK